MFRLMMFGKSKKSIFFTVKGKPPHKSKWRDDDVAKLIIKLRKEALGAREKAGLHTCVTNSVKLILIVHAPTVADIHHKQKGDDDDEKYIGDIDSLVAGVCDYLSSSDTKPGDNKFIPNKLFNDAPDVAPNIPILIEDDSQIQIVDARKECSKETFYTVEIQTLNSEDWVQYDK